MTLIERMAKQSARPCMNCKYNECCKGNNSTCPALKKWRDFRHQAYKQHITWCVKMMSFREE